MKRPALCYLLYLAVFSGWCLSAPGTIVAQTASSPESETPVTTGNPAIDVNVLELNLKHLTKEELVVEANGWRDLLKAKVKELSDVEVLAMTAEGDEKTQHQQTATRLREERTGLIDRLRVVLDDLQAKGGEVADYEKYISQVSGITLDAGDTSAAVTAILGWLQSSEGGIRWARNIVFFLITIVVFQFLARIAGGLVRRGLSVSKMQISDILKTFFIGTTRRLVFILGVIIAISMLEVNIGPLVAAIGVVGFVVGFALQDTLSNFAAGSMILLYRPYDIGDFISAGGVTGSVRSMSLVSTTLATPDNQNVVVPNGSIWGGVITNVTGNDTRRVDLTFGIGYSDDIAKAERVLNEIVTGHPDVLEDPAPVIRVHELGDSSVNFVCRPWTKTSDYWKVYWDLTRSVKERFDAEGISIPFPQQDVHMHQVNA